MPFALDIHSVWLPPFYANAGTARRLAMDKAILSAGQRGIVMTMDADAIAPPEWVALNVGGVDLWRPSVPDRERTEVAGHASGHPPTGRPPMDRAGQGSLLNLRLGGEIYGSVSGMAREFV